MAGTVIAPSATITGGTSIGRDCSIGDYAVIDDCIIGDNVIINNGARLSHCFIAHGATVDAGVEKSRHYLSKSSDLPISLP
jgi:mannose-1-phosphate guanylyltransferase